MIKNDKISDQTELVEKIWLEQVHSLENGEIVPAETFFTRFPHLLDQPEKAIDVIFNEYAILSGDHSTKVLPSDYYRRFPQLEAQLKKQFGLFDAVNNAMIGPQQSDVETVQARETGGVARDSSVDNKARFAFRRELGRGATSIVYEAWDQQLQRAVAIKKPHSSALESPRKKTRFIQEARAVARLHHPRIVPIHEIFELENETCLVSPLIEGQNLQELTQHKFPSQARTLEWVRQIADALHYAHENGIIHRDVKPSNVIINTKNQAMLADFGLALNAHTNLSITQTGELIGTPAFMSPEQVTSDERVDRRADIYSLGVLLYYLLSGKLPFNGSFSSVIHQLVNEPPKSVRHHNAAIPRDLEIITNKCLNKDPSLRYQTARAFSDDLQRFDNGETIVAKATGPVERAFKFAQRKPHLVAAAAISLAALAFAAGLLFQLSSVTDQRNRAQQAEQSNRTLLAAASSDAGRLAMQRGRLGEAAKHFESALKLQPSSPIDMQLSLVECYLALGDTDEAAKNLNKAIESKTDASNALVNYWKTELAAGGVAEFGDVFEMMEASDFAGVGPAKKRFLKGLNCANSLEALSCFKNAVSLDPYHHSARKMSLLMALSLARFDELLADASLAQQLYPEDVDFQLIEAIARAAVDEPERAIQIVRESKLEDEQIERWIAFCEFVHQKTRRLASDESISQKDLSTVADLVSQFTTNYQSLLAERRWRFPPRIAMFFDEFSTLDSSQDFETLRELTRLAVKTHPECVLSVIAAECELKDDSVEQLEASRDLFRKATGLPAFVRSAHNSAWLGVYATSVQLVYVNEHEVEKNTQFFVEACKNLNAQEISRPNDLRVFALTLIKAGHIREAQRFVEQWIACSTSDADQIESNWHLGIVYQKTADWQRLYQLCDEMIATNVDVPDFEVEKWKRFRKLAQKNLNEMFGEN